MNKKLLILLLTILLVLPLSSYLNLVKADDLIIQNDGGVILVMNGSEVLAVSTQKEKKEPEKAPPPPTTPAAPAKTVPLVPAHMGSTVKIDPPVNNDKRVQVTITTPAPIPSYPSSTKPTPATSQQKSVTTPPTVITKTVDQVVAQGAEGESVFKIRSEQARQLIIEQGTMQVSTSLPLQINTLTHSLSAFTSVNESARISVLPEEAKQGIINTGFINNQTLNQAKINLTDDISGVNYTLQGEKKGKLLDIFEVKFLVEVKLSAQTGKVVQTPPPILFRLFDAFIK